MATEKDTTAALELPLLREMEQRAKEAEAKARDLERAEKRRQADADAAAEAAKAKDLDQAMSLLDAVKKREQEANAKLAELQRREDERLDKLVAGLAEETRERLAKYRGKVDAAVWANMVEDATSSAGAPPPREDGMPGPAPHTPGGARVVKTGERLLHPKSDEILDQLGANTTLAKTVLAVVRDEADRTKARFAIPTAAFVRAMKERSMHPTRLSQESLDAIAKSGKVTSR